MPGVNTNVPPVNDVYSVKGRFSWEVIADTCVPCLLRDPDQEKYVPVSIAETRVLNRYLKHFTNELFDCIVVQSFQLTSAEVNLLNQINREQCGNQLSSRRFTISKDMVVRLRDFRQYYEFLDTCYRKLKQISLSDGQPNKCGFIRLNNDSVVPYVVKLGVMYLPLFYFEGDTGTLNEQTLTIRDWDLAYLKFCCKMQGIRNAIFHCDSCEMISFDVLRKYFPDGTRFEDYWPVELQARMLNSSVKQVNGNPWISTPNNGAANTATVSVRSAIDGQVESMMNPAMSFSNVPYQNGIATQRVQGPSSVLQSQNPSPATYPNGAYQYPPSMNGTHTVTARMPTSHAGVPNGITTYPQTELPGLRSDVRYVQPPNTSATTNRTKPSPAQTMTHDPSPRVNGPPPPYSTTETGTVVATTPTIKKTVPAPSAPSSVNTQPTVPPVRIIRAQNGNFTTDSSTTNGCGRSRENVHAKKRRLVDTRTADVVIDLISPPSSPCPGDNVESTDTPSAVGESDPSAVSLPKLVLLPNIQNATYVVNPWCINDMNVCVLDTASVSSLHPPSPLIPLRDIAHAFQTTVDLLRFKLQVVLKLILYQPNKEQQKVLLKYQKCDSLHEEVPMILVNDFKSRFTHLQYLHKNENKQPKRARHRGPKD